MEDKEFRYPIIFADKEKTTLLLNNYFATNDYLEYALKHNVDVLYTQTESCSAVEVIYKFIKNGFTANFEEVTRCIDGIQLNPSIQVKFER